MCLQPPGLGATFPPLLLTSAGVTLLEKLWLQASKEYNSSTTEGVKPISCIRVVVDLCKSAIMIKTSSDAPQAGVCSSQVE